MAQTRAAARLLSKEDAVLEILQRVSTDRAALFRCAAACKRWRALVADRSFLSRCWPEESAGGPSTIFGFFNRQREDMSTPGPSSHRMFFVPPPEGSVFGAERRPLTSMVDGLRDDDSYQLAPTPLAARHGLVLVGLLNGICRHHEYMAVCDVFARTCRVLPPLALECRASFVSCTILTGAECRRSLDYFKVLAVVIIFNNPENMEDQECNLYTFSSTESRWSAPTKCLDQIYRHGAERGPRFGQRISGNNVVCGATAHWLIADDTPKYYILDVSADTGHTSLTELPIPASQLKWKYFSRRPILGVAADGSLSLFCMRGGARERRIDMWKRGNDVDNGVWLHSRAIELPKHLLCRILPVEKSGTLLLLVRDESQSVHKINVETGVIEKHQFQNAPGMFPVPMTMDWLTWFASRLGS